MAERRHYTALDGMRGIAAIAVVITHGGGLFGRLAMPGAYLAVDLFFALSGFVIAHAYGRKLAGPMTPGMFLRARVVRLFPLYLAGTGLTLLAAGVAMFALRDAGTWTVPRLALSLPLAVLMLPSPFGTPNIFFPLNFPAWSLFYEMLVNVVYALLRARIVVVLWAAVIAASAVGIVAQATLYGDLDQGALWSSGAWALARVGFSFPVGVLLYQWRHRIRLPPISTVPLMLVLMAALAASPPATIRPVYDVLFVLVLSPVLVMLGSNSAPTRLDRAYGVLGLISYPIYTLHTPLYGLVTGGSRRFLPGLTSPAWAPWSGLAVLAGAIVAAWVAGRVDLAFQGWMRRRALARA